MNQGIRKHLRNFWFLLLTFATGLFYFCFYLVGMTTGVTMAFTLVGLLILHYVLRSTSAFIQHERIQTEGYTDISIGLIPSRTRTEGSLWDQVKAELSDMRNWKVWDGNQIVWRLALRHAYRCNPDMVRSLFGEWIGTYDREPYASYG
ncbi:sensor domain-containing protein [Paenibacillus frigoriresistens]|nr:sensor domain-containing protein [Paenibacillus frigoriresistens]